MIAALLRWWRRAPSSPTPPDDSIQVDADLLEDPDDTPDFNPLPRAGRYDDRIYDTVIFTAACPACGCDAQWIQGRTAPARLTTQIVCASCGDPVEQPALAA